MPVMKRLTVGGVNYDTVGEASVTQVQTSGTKIATVSIDGTSTDIYAPEGGGGSTVTVTQTLASGTEVGSISVDGTSTTLYAPTPPTVPSASSATPAMDGTAATGTATAYARADHVHPTDTSRLGGIVLNTSAEPYDVPVSSGTATITIGDGLKVSDSGNAATLSAKTGTTSGTVAAGDHTHSNYQQTLVSGTNIKTINGDSILGSGDLTVGSSVEPSSTAPAMDGTAAVGTATTYARADHVHPTDTSRQATLVSGTNIKTVNGNSILGSGDLVVGGSVSMEDTDVDAAVEAAWLYTITNSVGSNVTVNNAAAAGDTVAVTITSMDGASRIIATIVGASNSTVATWTSAGTYTFTMPNDNVEIFGQAGGGSND